MLEDATNSDRRTERRHLLNAEIWADPGGVSVPIPCMIRNVSTNGARIFVSQGVALPDVFFVKVGDATRQARVIWRRAGESSQVGVKFECADISSRAAY